MRIAVVGVTGLVGNVICELLEKRKIQIDELIPVASEKSVGKKVEFKDVEYTIVSMEDAVALKPDVAIFSAGGNVSLEWAPKFEEVGTTVVDNSSAWRMVPDKKLIVPEINASSLSSEDKIIANPNCSTIQMVMALAPLHREYEIERLVISTYQSFSGTGSVAVRQYENEVKGVKLTESEMAYPYPIFANAIPHCDVFMENGYTKEEMKLVNETRKILNAPEIRITATAVRIPVFGGHSESVNVEFKRDFDINDVVETLNQTPGVVVKDDVSKMIYPMPLYSHQKDDVYVGRIRRDESNPNSLNMWVVADNLRKGAATNAIQIVEYLVSEKLI